MKKMLNMHGGGVSGSVARRGDERGEESPRALHAPSRRRMSLKELSSEQESLDSVEMVNRARMGSGLRTAVTASALGNNLNRDMVVARKRRRTSLVKELPGEGDLGGTRMCGCIPLMATNHTFVMRWNLVLSVVMLVVAYFVPYDTAFLEPSFDSVSDILVFFLNRGIDTVFLFDMALTFNLAVADPETPGVLVWDRMFIARKYAKGWLFIDVVSVFPFDGLSMMLEAHSNASVSVSSLKIIKVLRLLRLTKLVRLLKANKIVAHIETNYEIDYGRVQLCGFLLMLFFLTHWLACGWFLIINVEQNDLCYPKPSDPDQCCYNWLTCEDAMEDKIKVHTHREYLLSLVWSAGEVFTTLSYVRTVTPGETIYHLFAQVVCGIAYAYLLGALCSIFAAKSKRATEFYEDMDVLNTYLREQEVHKNNKNLCVALRQYFRFTHAERDSMSTILESLCPILQGMLAYQVHSKWVNTLEVFADLSLDVSQTFFLSLARKLEVALYAPFEAVISPHHVASKLFIVQKGIVMVSMESSMFRFKNQGEIVGEDAMSCWRIGQVYGYQATAVSHGRSYELHTSDIEEIMLRPQHHAAMVPVFRKIARMRTKRLLLYFCRVLRRSVEKALMFSEACEYFSDDLDFVPIDTMPGFFAILLGVFLRKQGTWPLSLEEQREAIRFDEDLPASLAADIVEARGLLDQQQREYKSRVCTHGEVSKRRVKLFKLNTMLSASKKALAGARAEVSMSESSFHADDRPGPSPSSMSPPSHVPIRQVDSGAAGPSQVQGEPPIQALTGSLMRFVSTNRALGSPALVSSSNHAGLHGSGMGTSGTASMPEEAECSNPINPNGATSLRSEIAKMQSQQHATTQQMQELINANSELQVKNQQLQQDLHALSLDLKVVLEAVTRPK